MWAAAAQFVHEFLTRIARTYGTRAVLLFLFGAVVGMGAGAFIGFSGTSVWLHHRLDEANDRAASANQRAETAESRSRSDDKLLVEARAALASKADELEAQKSKYETIIVELKRINDQLLAQLAKYQTEEARKKSEAEARAKQQQALRRLARPQIPILSELPVVGDISDAYAIPIEKPLFIMQHKYSMIASRGSNLFGGQREECRVTVTKLDTNESQYFDFKQAQRGVISVGDSSVPLSLVTTNNSFCAFTYLSE